MKLGGFKCGFAEKREFRLVRNSSFPRPLASGELLQNPKREKLENLNE